MNVVFLDIDGVMNHRFYMVRSKLHSSFAFCPEALVRLKEILDATNSKIVLSSSWRIGETVENFKRDYLIHYELEDYLVGLTPFSGNFNEIRGEEIRRYINSVKGTELQVDKFIILDDDSDMGEYMDKLVHCKEVRGLTEEKKDEAIKLMLEA